MKVAPRQSSHRRRWQRLSSSTIVISPSIISSPTISASTSTASSATTTSVVVYVSHIVRRAKTHLLLPPLSLLPLRLLLSLSRSSRLAVAEEKSSPRLLSSLFSPLLEVGPISTTWRPAYTQYHITPSYPNEPSLVCSTLMEAAGLTPPNCSLAFNLLMNTFRSVCRFNCKCATLVRSTTMSSPYQLFSVHSVATLREGIDSRHHRITQKLLRILYKTTNVSPSLSLSSPCNTADSWAAPCCHWSDSSPGITWPSHLSWYHLITHQFPLPWDIAGQTVGIGEAWQWKACHQIVSYNASHHYLSPITNIPAAGTLKLETVLKVGNCDIIMPPSSPGAIMPPGIPTPMGTPPPGIMPDMPRGILGSGAPKEAEDCL